MIENRLAKEEYERILALDSYLSSLQNENGYPCMRNCIPETPHGGFATIWIDDTTIL